MCAIELVAMSPSQVEEIVEVEIVEAKDAHHGAIVEAEIVEVKGVHQGVIIGVKTRSVRVIGPVSSVATITSPLEPNVTDVDATKMAQVETIHPIVHLKETTLEAVGDQKGDKVANVSQATDVEENGEVGALEAHSETGAVVDSTHKVMNRNPCIETTEAYKWEMRVAAQTMSG